LLLEAAAELLVRLTFKVGLSLCMFCCMNAD